MTEHPTNNRSVGPPEAVRVSVGALAAIVEQDRIALVRVAYGGQRWQLPGGFIEAGETPAEAVRRELAEELGIEVVLRRFAGICYRAWEGNMSLVFTAALADVSEVRLDNDEVSDFAYFPLDELPEPVSPRTRAIVEQLRAGDVPFLLAFTDPDTGESEP